MKKQEQEPLRQQPDYGEVEMEFEKRKKEQAAKELLAVAKQLAPDSERKK